MHRTLNRLVHGIGFSVTEAPYTNAAHQHEKARMYSNRKHFWVDLIDFDV